MTNTGINYVVVIPAGGLGTRFSVNSSNSVPKQLTLIAGKTVIEHAVSNFITDENCLEIVIPTATEYIDVVKDIFAKTSKLKVIEGGKSRSESVRLGLKVLLEAHKPESWVMVHDAARPNLSRLDIDQLISVAEKIESARIMSNDYNYSGAILATRSNETIKESITQSDKDSIKTTLDRQNIWQAKTPQMFRLSELNDALISVSADTNKYVEITDEASAMEMVGKQVLLVEGQRANIKLTYPSDIKMLEYLLNENSKT